jgi:hypothetical protein
MSPVFNQWTKLEPHATFSFSCLLCVTPPSLEQRHVIIGLLTFTLSMLVVHGYTGDTVTLVSLSQANLIS